MIFLFKLMTNFDNKLGLGQAPLIVILNQLNKCNQCIALWESFNGRCHICILLRIFNFASHFIRIQIFQIDLSTQPLILSASKYFRQICLSFYIYIRNEHFSISLFGIFIVSIVDHCNDPQLRMSQKQTPSRICFVSEDETQRKTIKCD